MSLKQWLNNGWLRVHRTSPNEIENLLGIVERDLADAKSEGISSDWQFGIAYNAALKLCSLLLYAEGYRPERSLQHYRSLQAMPLILGVDRTEDAEYLDACRVKRNTVEYDYAGGTTRADARELINFTEGLRKDVVSWLSREHPDLAQAPKP